MTAAKPWLTFREFFVLATEADVDLVEAAEALLTAIKARQKPLKVAGIHKIWDPPSDAEEREWSAADREYQEILWALPREIEDPSDIAKETRDRLDALRAVLDAKYDSKLRLPLDPELRTVPRKAWDELRTVTRELGSIWHDDPEDPAQWVNVDWLEGNLNRYTFDFVSVGGGLVELQHTHDAYSGLCVEAARGKELLKRLSGAANRRGSPEGARDPEDDALVEEVVKAIQGGDKRQVGTIVKSLMAIGETPEADALRQRRIVRNVRNAMRKLEAGSLP